MLLSKSDKGGGGKSNGQSNNKNRKQSASITVNEHDRARLELKLQRDNLQRHSRAISDFADRQTLLAKGYLTCTTMMEEGAKKRAKEKALLCLRRKRMHEEQLKKVMTLQENIEKMILTVEFASIQSEVLTALKTGTQALNDLNKVMSVDQVEKVADDAADAIQDAQAVSALLAEHLTVRDEDAVQEEVDALELLVNPDAVASRKKEEQAGEATKPNNLAGVTVPTEPLPTQNPTATKSEDRQQEEEENGGASRQLAVA